MKIRSVIVAMFMIGILMLSGCAEYTKKDQTTVELGSLSLEGLGSTNELKKFSSISELEDFLQKASEQDYYTTSARSYAAGGMGVMMEAAMDSAAPAAIPVTVTSKTVSNGAQDYSTTNVQYEQVDEADYVKNDDRYIYMLSGNELIIIDAYDAENSKIVYEEKIGDNDYLSPQGRELFVKGDKLVLFVQYNEPEYYFEMYDIEPRTTYRQNTKVFLYDITDRSNPELTDEYIITGSYYQSRLIGNKVYLVTQEWASSSQIPIPLVKEASAMINPEIYYFDNPESSYQFNTIVSIDIDSEELIDTKTFMLGYSNTLMVSEKNIYISYQEQPSWRWYSQYDKDRFYDVILPRLPLDLRTEIQSVSAETEEESWKKISEKLSDFFKQIEEQDKYDEYQNMFEDIAAALEEYDTQKSLQERKTIIHKIGINDGVLEYKAKAEIDGNLLNQFSLDEFDGYLRAASTVNIWNRRSNVQYSNVYVMNPEMEIIGEISEIAPGESIYSTRFMGDKLYMTTFERIDPFFVIDLSDPESPAVLGELKIPGYSDYLHPYDENHIIGVGKETVETNYGYTTGGVKIALFDVSDVSNPEVVDSIEIGDQGSDSAILHDHKAFLFSKEKNLLVLPITEVTDREVLSRYNYRNTIWNGAYVFNIDENGFTEKGKIKHSSSTTDYFNWWNEATVSRSLYMDDNLYTISTKYVKANSLDDLSELNTIKLPTAEESYPYPLYD